MRVIVYNLPFITTSNTYILLTSIASSAKRTVGQDDDKLPLTLPSVTFQKSKEALDADFD